MVNTKLLNGLAESEEGFITTSFSDDYGNKGRKWTCNNKITIPASSSVFFLLDLCSLPECSNVRIDPINFKADSAEVDLKVYENTNYEGGDVLQCRNVNRRIDNPDTYDFIVTQGATGTTKGTRLSINTAFANGGTGFFQASTTDTGGNTTHYPLNKGYNYLMEFENLDAVATKLEFEGFIYES